MNGISGDVQAACVMINGELIWLMRPSAASHGPSSHILSLASVGIFAFLYIFPILSLQQLYIANITPAGPVPELNGKFFLDLLSCVFFLF